MWEARQLIASGVLPVSEYPTFDADSGLGILGNFEETAEELEIELNEDEVRGGGVWSLGCGGPSRGVVASDEGWRRACGGDRGREPPSSKR